MIRRLMMCAAAAAVFALPAMGQTLDEIVAGYTKASGGAEKWKAVKSMRVAAKITTPNGMEIPIVSEEQRPNIQRQELTLQGMTQVQVFDGTNGYAISPFQGKKDPEPMTEDDKKEMAEDYIDGEIIDAAAKGIKLEYVGKEPVEGSDTFKVRATMKSGTVKNIYIDTDSFLPVKTETKRTIRGTEREMEAVIGDYKETDGLVLPYSIEQGPKNSQQKAKITITKYEINPQIDAARFAMPANLKAAPPAPATPKKEPAKDEKKPEEPKKDK
jgi:outer membrane lipoprotein-sorting protein